MPQESSQQQLAQQHEPGGPGRPTKRLGIEARVEDLARRRPDLPFFAPFMAFLLLLLLNDALPYNWRPVAIALRGGLTLVVFALFWRHYPRLGSAHWSIAIVAGVAVAAGWVAGQHLLDGIWIGEHSLGGRLFLFPGHVSTADPRAGLSPTSWWSQVVLRIAVSATAVPIAEELFWRGFMLRALIDWDHFERVPLGAFSWLAFLGTSLLSILEHPDNWGVSILCWMAYNALMYWKKSLLLLILTHGITNLVLYTYVVWAGDWRFW